MVSQDAFQVVDVSLGRGRLVSLSVRSVASENEYGAVELVDVCTIGLKSLQFSVSGHTRLFLNSGSSAYWNMFVARGRFGAANPVKRRRRRRTETGGVVSRALA